VTLPASTEVTLTFDSKHVAHAGKINYLRRPASPYSYLTNDLSTWTTSATYNIADVSDGTSWGSKSITFTTDAFSGIYTIALSTQNNENDELSLANLTLHLDWSEYSGGTGTKYKLATGYEPTRFIKQASNQWITLVKGSDKDTLADGEWIYAAPYVYYRSESGAPSTQTLRISYRTAVTESGIAINAKDNVTIDGIDVIGWPGAATIGATNACGGICADGADNVTIKNCDFSCQYRRGISINNGTGGSVTTNTGAYGGASGLILAGTTAGVTVDKNTVSYMGYQSNGTDDGEGLGLGNGTSANILEDNTLQSFSHTISWE